MMNNTTPICLTAAAGLLAASTACAAPDSSPLYPVSVQASEMVGYDFEFVIHNCDDTYVTGIYIEAGWTDFFSGSAFDRNLRVGDGPQNFIEGDADPSLLGWTDALVSYEVPDGFDGLGSHNTATVAFVANEGVSLGDLEAAFGGTGFRVGLGAIGYNGSDDMTYGFAEQGVNEDCLHYVEDGGDEGEGELPGSATGVPSPSAALLGLALLGLTAQRRRRDA